ncbi:hypothetical protein ABZU75_23680 [Streptosporangium sp. NPDC005286]|uniref:hypothetical protein n=1 Tax=Streptosporangium sp. NPDC005286 TaxID=3154463 RepID=UPI0033BB675C
MPFPSGPVRDLIMLAGVLGAVAQTAVERMLSFTPLGHIGVPRRVTAGRRHGGSAR